MDWSCPSCHWAVGTGATDSIGGRYEGMLSLHMDNNAFGFAKIRVLLQHALSDLQLEVGPVGKVFDQGQVHGYFEEVRKAISSFKDGALNASTVLVQVMDAVAPISAMCEGLWAAGTPT